MNRRLLATVMVVAAVAGMVGAPNTPPPVAAAGATFDPRPGSVSFGTPSAFPSVVASGAGRYHAVARTDGFGQFIQHRVSDNAGISWQTTAMLTSPDGGATRPRVAADGDTVAISFIGGYCTAPTVCGEAPFLAVSRDGGRRFNGPVRLDTHAFDAVVAVDGEAVWVAWERGSTIEIRGTADAGATFPVSESIASAGTGPDVSAAGSTVVVAWNTFDGPRAVVGRGSQIGPVQTLGGQGSYLPWRGATAVEARGAAHVVVKAPSGVYTRSVAPGVTAFAPRVDVFEGAANPSISARDGLVAVGLGTNDGTAYVTTSANGGVTFSGLEPVAAMSGGAVFADVTVARRATDRPQARFDWSVPDRYPAGASGRRSPALVAGSDQITVNLTGCTSLPPSGGTISEYRWTVDGADLSDTDCNATIQVADGDTVTVRLEVTAGNGTTNTTASDITPVDHLIVSIGDSIASGEGNPHTDGHWAPFASPTWDDRACHRSDTAGPARAAAALEDADPRSSVTFIHLACSGASILDTPDTAGAAPSGPDDKTTGGVLDPYEGIEPLTDPPRPPQIDQMIAAVGTRSVDALLVSIGANDIRFSEVVKECIASSPLDPRPCHRSATASNVNARLGTLPERYAQLATRLGQVGVPAESVFITEYFDPTVDDLGLPNLQCIADSAEIGELAADVSTAAGFVAGATPNPVVERIATAVDFLSSIVSTLLDGGLVTDDEAAWARAGVVGRLNQSVQAAAQTHGWNYVGGIANRFDRHGYCATDPWVVTLGESLGRQHDKDGSFHPDANGHEVYGDAIEAAVAGDLTGGLTPAAFSPRVSLGDVYVTVSNSQQVWASIVRDTGGVPELVDIRQMDRLSSGDGYQGPGTPAADEASAVTPWWRVSNDVGALPTAMLGQITLAENIGVRSVTVAQAPADGTVIVADRQSVVLATIDARIAGSQTIDVTTEVIAEDSSGTPRTVLGPTTQQVTVVAGRNDVLLPIDDTFTVADGEKASANVTVSEAIGPGGDPTDNFATSTSDRIPTARETRELETIFMPADVGGSSVSCASVGRAARRMASYASDAMPVAGDGIGVDLACTSLTMTSQSEPAVLDALAQLDHLARLTAKDVIVAVVPEGWLRTAADGAVGVAAPGLRAVIVENTAPPEALAHEIAHTFGVLHLSGPAEGVRITTRTAPRGVDWMNPFVGPKVWTGGDTWDTLLGRIGGPLRAPRLPDPAHPGIWVRGTVEQLANGDWVVGPATWTPANDSDPASALDLLDELQLERMTVEQRSSSGDLLEPGTEVPIEAAAGIYGADPGADPQPVGGLFATRIDIHPEAATLRLVQSGVVIDERPVGAPPIVTVNAPLAGAVVSRGSTLAVTWTAADSDSSGLTADVLVSSDGTDWQPLAVGLDAGLGTAELPVPADLDGTEVRVRVVVSDGVRSGQDDSDPFTVDGGGSDVVERVAFSRDARIFTMAPDGTQVTPVDLPTEHGYDFSGYGFDPVQWRTPHLGTDGRIYVAGNYVTPLWDPQVGSYPPVQLARTTAIFSVLPDGSDLRKVSRFGGTANSYTVLTTRCPESSPDGARLTWRGYPPIPNPVLPDSYESIVVANLDGSGQRMLLDSGQSLPASVLNATWYPPEGDVTIHVAGCPRWSPDGTRIALLAGLSYQYTFPGRPYPANVRSQAVPVVIDVATGAVEVLADQPRHGIRTYSDGGTSFEPYDYWAELDWLDNGRLFSVLNESSGMCGYPYTCTWTYTQVHLDATTGEATRVRPAPSRRLQEVKVAPGGELLYGSVGSYNPTGATAYDFGVYDPAADTLEVFPIDPAYSADIEFDWGFATVGGGPASEPVVLPPPEPRAPVDTGGPYQAVQFQSITLDAGGSTELPGDALVEWDLDGDGNFGGPGDARGLRPEVVFDTVGTRQIRVRSTVAGVTRVSDPTDVVVSEAVPNDPLPPVPGADGPVVPAVAPTDVSVTVPTGSTTAINLQPTGTRLAVVDESESAGLLVLGVPRSSGAPGEVLTTDADGVLLVSPAAGFLGTTRFTVASPFDGSLTATVTVTVVGNVPPVAGDDSRSVTVGQVTTFAASELLENDVDPDGTVGGLRVIAVHGATNGEAWIDPAGTVFVAPDATGEGTAEVVVADADGSLATSRLLLTVTAAPTPTEPPPAVTVPAGTAPAVTAPVPAETVPASPVAAPPREVAPSATTPGGGLPATGGDIGQTGGVAALLLLLGCAVVVVTRVRRAVRTE